MQRFFFIFLILALPLSSAWSLDYRKRLGVGLSNQLAGNIAALSFKTQSSRTFAWGGLAGLDTSDTGGGWAVGFKAYRLLFAEPNLNFYGSALGALVSKRVSVGQSESGFQADITLGSEFAFEGLKSIGFSFEFGVSMQKIEDFEFKTVGNHIIAAGIHFYL